MLPMPHSLNIVLADISQQGNTNDTGQDDVFNTSLVKMEDGWVFLKKNMIVLPSSFALSAGVCATSRVIQQQCAWLVKCHPNRGLPFCEYCHRIKPMLCKLTRVCPRFGACVCLNEESDRYEITTCAGTNFVVAQWKEIPDGF